MEFSDNEPDTGEAITWLHIATLETSFNSDDESSAADNMAPRGISGWQKARRLAGKVAVGALISLPVVAPVAAVGAMTAATQAPASIRIAPGLIFQASPQRNASSVEYGPTTVKLPNAVQYFHGRAFGIRLNTTQLDTYKYGDQGQIFAAIADDPREMLAQPISRGVETRAVQGAIVGGVVAEVCLLGFIIWRRRRKAATQEKLSELGAYDGMPETQRASLPDPLRKRYDYLMGFRQKVAHRSRQARRQRLITGMAVLCIAAAGAGLVVHDWDTMRAPASGMPLFPESALAISQIQGVVDKSQMLRGASITGDVGHFSSVIDKSFATYKQKVDKYWQGKAVSFTRALARFRIRGGMAWQENPNIGAFALVSDDHDSHPATKYLLPAIFKDMGVNYVVNLGDQLNYSQTLFLDNGGWKRAADALPTGGPDGVPVQAIVVTGNHGNGSSGTARSITARTAEGKTYHPFIPLDGKDGYSTTMDGMTFVGSPDLNRTTDSGTTPSSPAAEMANDAKQGHLLADKACQIYQDTGEKPIVLAHERQATYEAIARGCVKLALSGHLHETLPVQVYKNFDGSMTYQENIGTASGDGPNNTAAIYNKATRRGAIEVWLYNRTSGQILNHHIDISYGPSGPVHVSSARLPAAGKAGLALENPLISDFATRYGTSGTWSQPTPPSASVSPGASASASASNSASGSPTESSQQPSPSPGAAAGNIAAKHH